MLYSGGFVRLTRTRSIRCYECGEEIGDLRLSRFLQSREEESQCGWCMVSSFASLSVSVSVSLSLSLSQSWSFESVGVVCLLLIWLCCREICLLYRFSLPIGSNWVFFVFTAKVTDWPKNYFELFLVFDKFHRHFAMRWSNSQKLLFPFWRKSQHR